MLSPTAPEENLRRPKLMEDEMMVRKISQRVVVTAAAIMLSAGGTFALAGTAFAHDSHGEDGQNGQDVEYEGNGGDGGAGGEAKSNCVVPLGLSAGVMGQGGPVSQCQTNAGHGGDGGGGESDS
ncbi:MAG TPA: hypothetical protein VK735_09785 [Pseudonocardia sp.]|uniref:hypothetical protein n=1 Tax=Pseudonocardia sp. TaxID=60912 RepID=UPI002CFB3C67|nr:hypothetical protein [Pseudonocardia sp.]HTF47726.1 hypothetical protein [Pseudonocardia sp.]